MTTANWTDHRCPVCRGTGSTYLEHPDGSLAEQPCPYCKGRKDQTWVPEFHQARANRQTKTRHRGKLLIAAFLFLLWETRGWLGGVSEMLSLLWIAMFIGGLVGLGWWYAHPKPGSGKAAPPRKPDPMTTPEEKLMGGALLGGAFLKHEWEQFRRRG